ncbi:MAG: zinc dependent phospholipase C family protein [Dehalococcoidia bacterium]|nr:zinc dependent phospholipase C family protein [Dehalococcoidia bacterium]
MPPITLHMVLARDIARELEERALIDAEGQYLLGSTTPDIRVLTRQDREETHFFSLEGSDHQDSVAEFFRTHSHLVNPANLNVETRAFVAGYITHLVFDQQYVHPRLPSLLPETRAAGWRTSRQPHGPPPAVRPGPRLRRRTRGRRQPGQCPRLYRRGH